MLKSQFLKNVFLLVTGTAIGQLIIILTMPLVSRIYTPHQFGIYSTLVSIIGILSVVTTLRYDIAIAISKNKEERNDLLSLSLWINLIISILVFFLLMLSQFFVEFLTFTMSLYVTLVVFLIGNVQIYTNLSTANGYFKEISTTKLTQSLSQVFIQLIGYLFKNNTIFLFLGYLIGRSNGLFYLLNKNKKNYKVKSIKRKEVRIQAYKYREYPMYGLPSSLINAVSSNVVILLIVFFFNGFYAGIFGFISRMISAPLQLVSKSYNSALFKLSHENSKEKFKKIYIYTTMFVFLIFSTIITIYLLLPFNIFLKFFGSNWGYIDEIFLPLLIMNGFQFSIIPFSEIFTIYNKQNIRLAWDLFNLTCLAIIFCIGWYINISFNNFIILYSIMMSILYLIMHSLIIHVLFSNKN